MYYEQIRSSQTNYFKISPKENENSVFPLHLHDSYEFIFVEDGLLRVEINGFSFDVTKGHGAFVLPGQPHEFSTPKYSRSWLVIFSSDHLPEMKKLTSSKGLFCPVIKVLRQNFRSDMLSAEKNKLRIRSILYELAAQYFEGESAPYLVMDDSALVCRVVEYIDNHYMEPMTLEDLSTALGYSYRYMSGVVNRFFKLPLPRVVNRYRVNYACDLLTNTNTEITQIALICGFGSMRSFNRNFKAVVGISPREYRSEKR